MKTRKTNSKGAVVIGIDPGKTGALVALYTLAGKPALDHFKMPVTKSGDVDFDEVTRVLALYPGAHVFLERAVSFGMGTKGAFNYGRGFAMVEIAVRLSGLAVTYTEPSKWTKVMHAGIDKDLKAKAKSEIALQRLYKTFWQNLPRDKKGAIHPGVMDAILIAGYGQRELNLVF